MFKSVKSRYNEEVQKLAQNIPRKSSHRLADGGVIALPYFKNCIHHQCDMGFIRISILYKSQKRLIETA